MQKNGSMSAYGAWRQICRQARTHLSPALYRACFAGTSGVEFRADALVISVPSTHIREQMERQLSGLLAALTQRVLHRPLLLRFTAPSEPSTSAVEAVTQHPRASVVAPPIILSQHKATTATKNAAATITLPMPELNARYTFETFVVGESNRLAYAASQNVAATPGQSYNPLFLYGGVGLGKTHLLMAIGHVAAAQGLRVFYISADDFASAMITAIQHNAQEAFRARYQAVDLLLVDDIQFIGGKDRTEEEFFHIFNALHNANKQIVLTSDRMPRAIPTLHDRLRSRFEWGLLADVLTPDYAHRLDILKAKAQGISLPIPLMVLEYLARPEGSSVRQLEGALNRLVMTARMQGSAITLSLAAGTLRECFGERGHIDVSPQVVMDLVASHFRVAVKDILGKGRTRTIAWPRQVTMFLLREETEHSLAQIGAALGGRDHTTIMHGCDQVAESVRHDAQVQREIETLRTELRAL